MGNFTLPIATYGATVCGVEGDAILVESAKINANKNALNSLVTFKKIDLFKINEDEISSLGDASKWLIDPPRDGALNLINSLNKSNKPKIICYISCNAASLARDASILINEKGYRFSKAGILNMFPHTAHVESIALFEFDEN